jgi:hypothetical protein
VRPLLRHGPAVGLTLVFALAGCGATVGDKCTIDANCGTTLKCQIVPNSDQGYCTRSPCRAGDCPAEARCVDFGAEKTYCMRTCDDDNECPTGLRCADPVAACLPGGTTNTAGAGCSLDAVAEGQSGVRFCVLE